MDGSHPEEPNDWRIQQGKETTIVPITECFKNMTSINTFTYLAINQRDTDSRAACFYHRLKHTKVTAKAITATKNTRLNKLAGIQSLLRLKPEMVYAVKVDMVERKRIAAADDPTQIGIDSVPVRLVFFLPKPDHGPFLSTKLEELHWHLHSMGLTE